MGANFVISGGTKRRPINGYPGKAEIVSEDPALDAGDEFNFCPDGVQILPLRNNVERQNAKVSFMIVQTSLL